MRLSFIVLLAMFVSLFTSNASALTLSGTIYGGSVPVQSATVSVFNTTSSQTHDSQLTNAGGEYTFTLDPGNYRLEITPPAAGPYGSATVSGIVLDVSEIRNIALLSQSRVLSGTITLPDGSPVVDGEVYIFNQSDGTAWTGDPLAGTRTDANGAYTFFLTPDIYKMSLYVGGYNIEGDAGYYINPLEVENLNLTGDHEENIVLPYITVSGSTVDSNGVPVPDVELRLKDTRGPDNSYYGNMSIRSDAQGAYSFRTPAYTYDVLVNPSDSNGDFGANEYPDVDLTTDTVRDFIVERAITLSGTITLPDGSPVVDGEVYIFKQSDSTAWTGDPLAETRTDANGAYTFFLTPDIYKMSLYVGGYSIEGDAGYYINPLEVENLNLTGDHEENIVLPYITVSGSTLDNNGVPVPDVELRLKDTRGPDDSYYGNMSIRSDAQGAYSFRTPAYTYDVLVSPSDSNGDFGANEYPDVDLTTDTVRDFILERAITLSGTITLPDGSPVVDGEVYIFKQSDSTAWTGNPLAETRTDANGAYTFFLTPDVYKMSLYVGGYSIEGDAGYYINPLEVENLNLTGDHEENIVLPYITVSGSTVDSNGVPIPDVELRLKDTRGPDNSYYGNMSIRSDTQGAYSFRTPAYSYDLLVVPPVMSGFSAAEISNIDYSSDTIQDIIQGFDDVTDPAIIAGPFVNAIDQKSALVEWQTNEPTNSQVSVGEVQVIVPGLRRLHSVAVVGLQPQSTYIASVTAVDSKGNGPVTSDSAEFQTASVPDSIAPELVSGPFIYGIGTDGATVSWTTTEPSTTELRYGAVSLAEYRFVEGLRSFHEIEIDGLAADTRYSLSISAIDGNGNGPVESPQISFQTLPLPDTRAPDIVAGPLLSDVTDTEATIVWTTDEPSVSGLTLFDGELYEVSGGESLTQNHELRLTGLEPEQEYFYTVSARDGLGNGPTLSKQRQFQTQRTPDLQIPVLTSSVRVFAITHHSAQIGWKLDEPATGIVEYGDSPTNLNYTEAKANLNTNKVIHLSKLQKDTTYYYRVRSIDSNGNEWVSEIDSFRTRNKNDDRSPSFLEQPVIAAKSESAVTLNWKSNEPTSAVIEYQGIAGSKRYNVPDLTVNHGATLTGLDVNQQYQFTVELTDKSGNQKVFDSRASALSARSVGSVANFLLDDEAVTGFVTTSEADTITPQFVVNPVIVASASDRLLLRWMTDEPTTAELNFGLTGQRANRAFANVNIRSEHFMVLSNLESDQFYDIILTVSDVAGNVASTTLSEFASSALSDITKPRFIATPVATSTDDAQTTIAWQADVYSMAELTCKHTVGGARWSTSADEWAIEGELTLDGLEPGSDYVCAVVLTDLTGNETESVALQIMTLGDSTDIDTGTDTDNDGLSDEQELVLGTDLNMADTDSDGTNDGVDHYPLDPTESLDSDNDGLGNNADLDDDGDTLPDTFEIANNLEPLIPLDAAQDADGDGWTNLLEYTQGTNISIDDNPPELIVPTYLVTQSTGATTDVDVGEAIAVDAVDGRVSVALDKPGPYVPGRHLLTWSAVDVSGNRVEALQVLDVLPTISFGQPVEIGEGGSIKAELLLNGYAPTYPVIVEYSLDGTALEGKDYRVISNPRVITIEEGLKADIELQSIADTELEGSEEVILTLGSVSGAVSGTSTVQLITIQDENRRPSVEISFKQADRLVSTVLASAGPVEVIATVVDPNREDSHQFSWQSSDARLNPAGTTTESSWFFSPASLDSQLYRIQVAVTDDGQPPLNAEATGNFRIESDAPVLLASEDRDNDGISDALEGYGDTDGDRIADFLDPLSTPNLLPLGISEKMLQGEPGTSLRLGLAAFASNGSGASIELLAEGETLMDAFDSLPPAEPEFDFPSGVIDFEVAGFLPGTVTNIVIPLDSAIPEDAQYRKYTAGFGWNTFIEDAENQISTAVGGEACPAPGHDDYLPGLREGYLCVQLSIKDGGANDADGIEDGVIQDPGGVAVAVTPFDMTTEESNNAEEETPEPETPAIEAAQPVENISPVKTGGGVFGWGFLLVLFLRLLHVEVLCMDSGMARRTVGGIRGHS